MRKIIALLMVIIMMCVSLVACVEKENNAQNMSDTGSSDSTEGLGDSEDSESDSVSSEVPATKEGAKLVGFRTAASLYSGPFNSTVGWKAAGMGYIIKTKSGNLIVIDGGNSEDAQSFYNLLREYSDTEHITIDYWILTHPHGDHVNCLIEMSEYKNMVSNITIKNMVYYFPEGFKDRSGNTCIAYKEMIGNVAKIFNADTIEPNNGSTLLVNGARIKFLYVPTDYEKLNNTNQLSLIFTVTTEKKIMFTGDAFNHSLTLLANTKGEDLKCDILQMPHHFLCDTGYKPFYEYADAHTVLLPTCISGYDAMKNSDEYKNNTANKANQFAESNAEKVYKAFDGTFEIDV
ncbi:MAG: MBL fold metallo-hydrolase [Ruminococcaceae bacterium]|nr:MBL fold metallo-hydrolase [Oscillospiraceae bacterium]